MAEKGLQKHLTLNRLKFRASVAVREVMVGNPDFTRGSLSAGAKVIIENEVNEDRLAKLQHLQKEGQMSGSPYLMALTTS